MFAKVACQGKRIGHHWHYLTLVSIFKNSKNFNLKKCIINGKMGMYVPNSKISYQALPNSLWQSHCPWLQLNWSNCQNWATRVEVKKCLPTFYPGIISWSLRYTAAIIKYILPIGTSILISYIDVRFFWFKKVVLIL